MHTTEARYFNGTPIRDHAMTRIGNLNRLHLGRLTLVNCSQPKGKPALFAFSAIENPADNNDHEEDTKENTWPQPGLSFEGFARLVLLEDTHDHTGESIGRFGLLSPDVSYDIDH